MSQKDNQNKRKYSDKEESDESETESNYNLRPRKKKRYPIIESSSESESEEEAMLELDILDLLTGALNKPPPPIEEKKLEEKKYLDSLTSEEREKLLKTEARIEKLNTFDTPLKYKVLSSNLEDKPKALLVQKVKFFEKLEPHHGEYFKMKKYMEGILNIPFKKYKGLDINSFLENEKYLPDKIPMVSKFIKDLRSDLDCGTYGQDKAKNSIIEIIGKWITNPGAKGNVIGLCGPAGIGKTTLIKNGLSKALKLPFSFIPLGGSMTANVLEGSDYTYEGSKWGRIVDILMEHKCMNPIIFFDELDKISNDRSGDEITALLIHLTDFSQNSSFRDRYFSGIDFDLSKCLFIFSFNDKSKINPILKDRINIIDLEGFETKDKITIARDYSFDKICENIGLEKDYIDISDETLKVIVSTYCSEKGVRKLEQCLNSLMMKINLYHITRDLKNLNIKDTSLFKYFSVPYNITPERAVKLLDPIYRKDDMSTMVKMMYN